MKKYLCMAAAGMFLFTACSNDDDAINGGNGNSSTDFTGQELVMKVANGGDGLTTKAGRPLYSSEAAQAIDKVKLAIFKLDGQDAIESCVYVKEFDNWNTTSSEYGNTTNGSVDHGRFESLNLKKVINETATDKGLDPGTYRVYAVGYTSTQSNYTYTPTLADIVANWDDATNFEYVSATTATKGEEIFAGEIGKITVDDKRNFTVVEGEPDNNVLYLHRQVAGAFGYFKNIPAAGPDGTAATGLRLVASDKNTKLNMTKFNSEFRDNTDNIAYVVNGETSATTADAKFKNGTDAFTVYDITLSNWFTGATGMDTNDDGVLNGDDTWAIPAAMQNDFKAIEGTVFGGEFVIPFANKNASTFELQLISGTGVNATILRSWTVNLAQVQTNVQDIEGTAIANESTSSYSIVRNHLYSIGEKAIANPTDPENPGPDPENPEDLSKGQILTLRVNDNWEVIHKLEVEPEI